MIKTHVDPGNVLSRALTELEKQQLPFAAMQAANKTAWEVREMWREKAGEVLDRPTAMTMRAVVYKRASKSNPVAEVKIRDEAAKGTPPEKYLQAQVMGGQRAHTRFEKALIAAGVMQSNRYAVPGNQAPLDGHGNLAGGVIVAMLSRIRASRDAYQNETAVSRRRNAGKGKASYFAVRKQRGKLRPGIYQRLSTGFGSAVRSMLIFVSGARYKKRFTVFDYAQKAHSRLFPFFFRREFDKAMSSARLKGGR